MTESHPIVEKFYYISEKSGEIGGKVLAGILNTTTSLGSVGFNALKKSNEKFVENVKPAFNHSRDKFNENMANVVPLRYKNYFTKKEINESMDN